MNILIIDDHRLFLEGLRSILSDMSCKPSIDTYSDTRQALAEIDSGRCYDLALVDLNMPGIDGFGFLHALGTRKIPLPVIVISASTEPASVKRALDLGAAGFIPKYLSGRELVNAIEKVLEGAIYVPADMRAQGITSVSGGKTSHQESAETTKPLDGRRQEVLDLIAQGHPNKSIAQILGIAEPTVKTHIASLFKFLKVNNRTACVVKAQQLGLIDSEPIND